MQKLTVLTAVVIVLGLGWILYKHPSNGNIVGSNFSASQAAAVDLAAPEDANCTNYSFDKKTMLSITNSASEEEKYCNYKYASSIAAESPSLNLTQCDNPEPLVLKVVNGAPIQVKNDGSADITMTVNTEHIYTVPAGGSISVNADFGNGPGLYGYDYGCNTAPGPMGMIFVSQP